MSTTRFDPIEGADYGTCNTCGLVLSTEVDANAHMSTTFEEAKAQGKTSGHGVRITNPGRERRIERAVPQEVEDAIEQCMSDLDDIVNDGHATEAEIKAALSWHPDFSDAWDEYIQEAAS